MDHCPLRARALWHFFESAPDQLSGDGLFGALQLNETLGQKTHAPALFALGRLRAGQSDQMGLLLCIELGGFGGLGPCESLSELQALERWATFLGTLSHRQGLGGCRKPPQVARVLRGTAYL